VIIDAHCHAGNFTGFISGGHHSPEELLDCYDQAEVGLGLISILDTHNMSGANDTTRAACERHEGRLLGYIYVNPTDVAGSIAELERCSKYDCFRGVKLHPMNDVYYPFHETYYPVFEKIEQLGLPTLWHSGTSPYSHPLQIAYVARQFSKIPFILGHFGLSDLTWECFPAADLADNICVDTTANPIIPVLNDWAERFGADRMLWGSDFPFYNVEYELGKIKYLGTSGAEKEMIGTENARRIFDL
jgi:predicted TIM-barrel fold metal-dependent hydrolase